MFALLALRFPTAGVGFVVVASAIVFFVYWIALLGGEALADRRVADPAVTMWLGNVVFFGIAVGLIRTMGRSSGTNRGGGGFGEAISRFFGAREASAGAGQ